MKTKPPKTSLCALIKQAYKNRYDFSSVSIDKNGNISGHFLDFPDAKQNLGRVSEHSALRTAAMNIQLKRGNAVIFTFAYDR